MATYNILFAAICIPEFVSVLFSYVEFRIKNTNQQQHVHLLHVPSPHNLIEIGHVLLVLHDEQFWRVSGSLKMPHSAFWESAQNNLLYTTEYMVNINDQGG